MTPITPEPPAALRNRIVPLAPQIGITILLLLAPLAPHAYAQPPAAKLADISSASETPSSYKTFYLTNLTRQQDANDIQTDLRNMLPSAKLYYVPSQSALSVRGSADDIALAQKILADLDRPRKAYRLTYTITETGSGQPVGGQHVTLIVTSGGMTDFKQGSKVPIVTGVYPEGTQPSHSDVQYQDVGLEIEATLNGYADGVHLRSKIAQSNVSDEKSGIGVPDPLFRQTTLDGTATLMPGKPLILGSLDIPGTNRHQQVEVVSEAIP
jgi:type II secretory pathway component GspD/PulD (secretin)